MNVSARRLALPALAVLGVLAACGGAAPDGSTDAPGDQPRLYVSTSGSDAGHCAERAPCATFARAYALARPGDVIEIDGGTYPTQELPLDPEKGEGAAVTLRPSVGAEVVVEGDLDIYASNVEIRQLHISDNWYAKPGSSRLTFRDVDTGKFYVASASDVRVIGGRIGPSVDAVAQIKAEEGSDVPSRSIVIDGVTFEDFTRSDPSQHMECLHVMAVDGLAIRNSTFRRCTIFDISLKEHGATEAMRNITIERNVLEHPIDGRTAINLSTSGTPCVNVLIRENTMGAGISVTCRGEDIRIEHNELPSMSAYACASAGDVVWDHNVYEEGVPCGPNDVVRGG